MAFMSWLTSRCAMWFRTNVGSSTPWEWRERFLVGTWLLGLVALVLLGDRLVLGVQAALWGLLLLSAALLLRSGTVRVFGPVLLYDLMCIARRGRYLWLRFAYAVVLLLSLTSLYVYWNSNLPRQGAPSSAEITRFAESFYLIFMAAEFLVVLLLTPAYVAGALAEEKDRGTLDHMLATDLSNREIVLSKLVARAANLAILILTGLPILSLTQFFGGIDPNLVLSGFAALGLTLASLACLSILHSTYARKPRDAIIFTYLSAVGYLGISYVLGRWAAANPGPMALGVTGEDEGRRLTVGVLVDAFTAGNLFTALQKLIEGWKNGQPLTAILPGLLGRYAIFHGVMALCCTAWAVARVRIVAMKQAGLAAPGTARGLSLPPVALAMLVWVVVGYFVVQLVVPRIVAAEWAQHAFWSAVLIWLFGGLVLLYYGRRSIRRSVNENDDRETPTQERKRRFPPLGEAPVAWREVFVERGYHFNRWARLIVAALVLVSFAPALETLRDLANDVLSGRGAGPNWRSLLGLAMAGWVQQMGTLVACLSLVGVAVRAAGSISGERDRQTMDGLLLTPLRRDDMLRGKWLGSILSMRWAWVWLAAIWALGVATGGMSFLAVPLLMLAWLIFATMAANIGLFFSISSRTTLRATMSTLVALAIVSFGHWALWFCLGPLFLFSAGSKSEFPEWVVNFEWYGMTPPWTLQVLAFQGNEFQQPIYAGYRSMTPAWERFFCALVGLVCWGIVSIGLGWVNSGRFRREASGEPLHPSEFAGGAHPLSTMPIPVVETEAVPALQNAVPMSEEWEVNPPLAQPVEEEAPLRGAVLVEEDEGRPDDGKA
jgi:ABC-type transport system involved in multi-copper enzyme maturation permease subunit